MGSISKRTITAATDDGPTRKRRLDFHQVPASNYFPSDVLIAILSRLPVKALFWFKSVCTNWDAVIPRNPYLVSMHLRNYTNNPATADSLLCSFSDRGIQRFVSLSLEGDPAPQPINLPDGVREGVVCGAGNGLFLLGFPVADHPDYRLWNPATHEIRPLPRPPLMPPVISTSNLGMETPHSLRRSFDNCGAGMDLVANDVKVVLIVNYVYWERFYYREIRSSVFVYTLSSSCWRKLSVSCPYRGNMPSLLRCHTYFEGIFYWLCKSNDGYVVAFDMGNDVFHRIDCPFGSSHGCNLGVYSGGDSIALFKRLIDLSVDVWLLSKSGGQWRWIKHSRIRPFPDQLFMEMYWKNNQFIACMWETGNQFLVLFDIGSQECKVLIPKWMSDCCHIYKESLICIN